MLDTSRVEAELARARAFAQEQGLSDQLEQQLAYLSSYACEEDDRDRTRCKLFMDFAPYSFAFQLELRQKDGSYKGWMNGGLIYHGPNGGRGGAPEFSVSLVPVREPQWQIHT